MNIGHNAKISQLPPLLREIAILRMQTYASCFKEQALEKLISNFYWEGTPEGDKFWRNIRDTGEIPEQYCTEQLNYEIC